MKPATKRAAQKACSSPLTDLFPKGYYPPLTSEMKKIMKELQEIVANPVVEAAYNDSVANVDPLVMELGFQQENPWTGTTVDDFVCYFEKWFTFLPQTTSGLGFIVPLTFFYLNNPSAFNFLNQLQSKSGKSKKYSKEIFNWSVKFIKARGRFMDSKQSTYYMKEWMNSLGPSKKDFIIPKGGYQSFNEFFTRSLNPKTDPRPISDPDDEAVLVASADTEINFIESNLTLQTSLPVKTHELNVMEL
ncbi:MAG: phosphatidylserine decarboxylase, partial [Arenicella sp.]